MAPALYVLAGVNGAGKSSIGGALLRRKGLGYFNPDEAAQQIREEIGCPVEQASALAWEEGRRRLEAAIESSGWPLPICTSPAYARGWPPADTTFPRKRSGSGGTRRGAI